MFSVISRLVFLLFTLLHIKPSASSLSHGSYIYQQPLKHFRLPSLAPPLLDIPPTTPVRYGPKLSFPQVDNYLSEEDLYVADGRLLKQYEVMEDIPGDPIPEDFLSMSPLLLESFLAKYGRISPSLIPGRQPPPILPLVSRNPGALALGSGSLGYIRLSNGGVYLGSGSLGYISGQDRVRDIVEARNQQNVLPAGPFSFGPSPSKY